MPRVFLSGIAFVAAIFLSSSVSAQTLQPFKDDLFAYPATLSEEGGGRYKIVDYREARDIDARDDVPEKRVKAAYVSTGVRRYQKDLALKTDDGRRIRHFAVGSTEGARFIVLYLHGQGGSRRQGVDDFTFGGNFNRIKNLAVANGGLYLSPDFPDFGGGGVRDIASLIDYYAAKSPGAPIVVACGSMGGHICWGLAGSATGAKLTGLMLLGSLWDADFLKTEAFRRRIPVFFGHGSHDTVFAVDKQEAFYRSLGKTYPARFVRFETGTHGTPIRMTDWRGVLNWILGGG
ncbi:MAG: alpha/beta hydrolase [Rhizobiales bacterium]|nr:alpha/beta hydrolase [Hyphomicrobiales bacterium]